MTTTRETDLIWSFETYVEAARFQYRSFDPDATSIDEAERMVVAAIRTGFRPSEWA